MLTWKPSRRQALSLGMAALVSWKLKFVPPPAHPTLTAIRADPANLFTKAGLQPDPWQAHLLRSDLDRVLMLACRQAGKTQTAAALTLKTALLRPGSLCLILSPTLRQSGEFFRDKVLPLYHALGKPVLPAERTSRLERTLANGSRIVSLPENEEGI